MIQRFFFQGVSLLLLVQPTGAIASIQPALGDVAGLEELTAGDLTNTIASTEEPTALTPFAELAADRLSDANLESLDQTTSVSQLADVQPTDWAYQALQNLVERYGCVAGYPDGTFRGNRALTRYEFAAGLNACLDQVNELITTATSAIPRDAMEAIARLQEEFAVELTTLQGRVNSLEAQIATLEANQFSTTTRLTGQAIFAVNAGGFEGDTLLDPAGATIARDDPNATFLYRVALDFNTSFTGTDLLKIRVDTGSNGANDNATGVLEPNFGSILDFSVKPPTDDTFGIGRLYYTFNPTENLTVSVGPDIRTTDYIDLSRYANLSFRDFTTQALVNNYILFPINGPSSGAAIAWELSDAFTLRTLYAAADAANPGEQSPIRGTAAFTRVLYPDTTPNTSGNRGIFGDTYQGMVELEYSPSNRFAVKLQYSGGEVFDRRFDVVGANLEFSLTRQIAMFGRYGYSSYNDTAFDDINPNYWMAGFAFPDLGLEGALAGLAAGQPFIVSEIGDATQTNFEAFYRVPVSDNIQLTPVVQVVTDPANQRENGAIVTGTLRMVFLF